MLMVRVSILCPSYLSQSTATPATPALAISHLYDGSQRMDKVLLKYSKKKERRFKSPKHPSAPRYAIYVRPGTLLLASFAGRSTYLPGTGRSIPVSS